MAEQQVVIEVSPSRLELAVVRHGTVAASRVARPDAAGWERAWPGVLDKLLPTLARFVGELGCAGAQATVLYSGPGSVATLSAFPSASPSRDARKAAEMAVTALADFPPDINPLDVRAIAHDRSDAPSTTPLQTHSLAVADADARASAIAAWVASAQLRPVALIPLDAVILHDAALRSIESLPTGTVSAVLWLSEQSSVLAVGRPGRLAFVRSIGVGTESFADALVRPLRARAAETAPVSLDRESVRSVLRQVGIPSPDALIPGHPELTGASLLPVLHPVIQRLALEIKQSVRFGVEDADRANVKLRFAGIANEIPNLAATLSAQSGFALDPQTDIAAAPRGIIASYLRHAEALPTLLPHAQRRASSDSRVRRALVAGVAAAVALIVTDAALTRAQLNAQTRSLDAMQGRSTSHAQDSSARDRALRGRLALNAAERAIRERLGESPDWPALMVEVGRATPPEIRLSTLELQRTAEGARCTLRASIRTDNAHSTAEMITQYLDRLGAIPLVRGVKLGACQRGLVDGHEAQSFELTLAAVELPALAGPAEGAP